MYLYEHSCFQYFQLITIELFICLTHYCITGVPMNLQNTKV